MKQIAHFHEIKTLYSLINGHTIAKIILKACELKIDKLLFGQSFTISELAKLFGFHENAALRFIRVLDAYEIVKLEEDQVVKRGRLCAFLEHMRGPHLINGYHIINHLDYSLQTNRECYSQHFYKTFPSHLFEDADMHADFQLWGRHTAEDWYIPIILHSYNFAKYSSFCEMGSEGFLLTAILTKHIINTAYLYTPGPLQHSLHPAITLHHDKQLPACDLYIFFRTLLKLNDDEMIKQLNDCYAMMGFNSKVLIIDFVIPNKTHPDYQLSTIADMNVLACVGGKIRNTIEWFNILQQTKFTMTEIKSSSHDDFSSPTLPLIFIEASK